MAEITYQIVRRGSGWAFRVGTAYSRSFTLQAEALEAAKAEARKMHEPGDRTVVQVEERPSRWRTELVIRAAD